MRDPRLNRYRTALDIRDTPYLICGKTGIIYHFSTETEMKNFQKKVELYIREVNYFLNKKFKISMDVVALGELDTYNRTSLKGWCIEYGGRMYDRAESFMLTDKGFKEGIV